MFQHNLSIYLKEITKKMFSSIPRCLVFAITLLTTLAVFVPISPRMPQAGLDASWVFSMNQAVAQKLTIGKGIIFSFGPYASIYTQTYHPSTDQLMLFGGLFLGLCYAAVLLFLAIDAESYLLLAFSIFLAGFMYNLDALFFSYPLILATLISKLTSGPANKKNQKAKKWQVFAISFLFAPLGLLPLVKGSFILLCGATASLIFAYSIYFKYRQLAYFVLVVPVASCAMFWVLSGQSILALPRFFLSIAPIISGYTEGMALPGNKREIAAFLFAVIVIMLSIARSGVTTFPARLFLSLSFALYFFIVFKGGFVRHDAHAIMAGISLPIAALIIGLLSIEKRIYIVLFISIASWAYIDKGYINTSTNLIFRNILNTYGNAWSGLQSRLARNNTLKEDFKRSLEEIRKEYIVPTLQGSTDIYSCQQSYLLASDNKWNPRPVFQSYATYAYSLAKRNEQHLRSNNAPDNVLFRVEPIDARLPSIEDGLSWPAIFDNYTVSKLDNIFIYLRKKQTIKMSSTYDLVYEGTHNTGEDVAIPISSAPIYAELNLKPTVLGKVLGLGFKPPQLKLTANLKDGTSNSYRVLSNMMKAGFFISPLVKNTRDFMYMAMGQQRYLSGNTVRSIVITPSYGDSIFWSRTYDLKLKAYRGGAVEDLPHELFDRMFDSLPEGYAEAQASECDGNIDLVNGITMPAPHKVNVYGILSVEGWLAVSARDGLVPDDIFVTLKSMSGITKYVKARRTPRNDVKNYFNKPGMPDVGFTATIDVTGLRGEYILGLASGYKDKLVKCGQFIIPVSISSEKD
jgi:hypothetical protein